MRCSRLVTFAGALALSGCALFALWAQRERSRSGDVAAAASLRRACLIALAATLVFEVFAAAVSVAVGRRMSF